MTMNYKSMSETARKKYDNFADEVYKLRGVSVYDCEEPYVELKKCAYKRKDEVKEIINKYGYKVANETESEGSSYTAYYIWFTEATDENKED